VVAPLIILYSPYPWVLILNFLPFGKVYAILFPQLDKETGTPVEILKETKNRMFAT